MRRDLLYEQEGVHRFRFIECRVSLCARIVAFEAFVVALFVTRWPLKPDWLLTFDNANFAFALDEFNPALHRPQPPGYPLFVGLSRLIHLYVNDAASVFFIAGIIGTSIAALMLAYLAKHAAGTVAGIAAACLFITHPAVLTEEAMNPVRIFLATGSAAVAMLAWRAVQRDSHWAWLAGAAAVLGIAGGFRPTLPVLMAPLLLYVGWRRRATPAQWALVIGAGAMTTAAWLSVTAASVGGLEAYLRLLSDYMEHQSETTSILFGASLEPALKMAGRALVWTFVPCLVWLAMLPFARLAALRAAFEQTGVFLLIWMVPPLLFYMLVHSAEPGHLMPVVVPVCFAGALVLSTIRQRPAAIAVSALAGVALFLIPVNGVMTMSSVRTVRWSNRNVAEGLSLIRDLKSKGPVTVVASPSSAIAWRLLSYYQSKDPVIVLLSDPEFSGDPAKSEYWIVRGGNLTGKGSGVIPLPDSGKVIWFLHKDGPMPTAANMPMRHQWAGPAFVTDTAPDRTITVGNFQFATAHKAAVLR